jgi:hypothetical protein
MINKAIYLIPLLVLSSSLLAGQSNGLEVIAQRSTQYGTTVTITVDKDDVVHDRLESDGKTEVTGQLGLAVRNSGNLELKQYLPKGMVATYARRISNKDSVTHVVLAWGLSKYSELSTCFLLIYKETTAGIHLILEQKELGTNYKEIFAEDLDTDGRIEVILVTSENKTSTLHVYQPSANGFEETQTISGYAIWVSSHKSLIGPAHVVVSEKATVGKDGSLCERYKQFEWSTKKKRFVQSPQR